MEPAEARWEVSEEREVKICGRCRAGMAPFAFCFGFLGIKSDSYLRQSQHKGMSYPGVLFVVDVFFF